MVFFINLNKPTSLPVNLGYPINSRFDDYDLSLSEEGTLGFLSSNRDAAVSLDDLYVFEVAKLRATGEVTDKQSGNNLKNVAVEIVRSGEEKSEMMLADNGHFEVIGEPGEAYELTFYKEGYTMESFQVSTAGAKPSGLYEVDLGRFPIEVGTAAPEPEEKSMEPAPAPSVEPVAVAVSKPETLFRVQIAASRKPLSNAELHRKYKGSRDITMFREDGWYKYAIGEFGSFFEANTVRLESDVDDAFIAAYTGEKKQKLSAAIEKVHTAPILQKLGGYSQTEEALPVDTYSIHFGFNSFRPVNVELAEINSLIQLLKTREELMVEITGHADQQGSAAYNLALAEARAATVANLLKEAGIDPSRVKTISVGERDPEIPCDENCSDQEYQQNRRAVIKIFQ